jgi:hypothetical protein
MRIINEESKVQQFLENNHSKEINVLLELRNGERLKPSSIRYFDTTPYGLCYAIMFDTYSRYTLYNKYGKKYLDKSSPYDIMDVIVLED